MEHNKRFCVDFILDRIREALLGRDDIMKEFERKESIDYTVSIKDIDGKNIKGTIIIKEES